MSVDPATYQRLAIASALRLYAKHGIRANRSYTPKAMMATAERLTGQKFRPRDYLGAAEALNPRLERAQ